MSEVIEKTTKIDVDALEKTIKSLKANNIEAEIVPDGASALARIEELIPRGSEVYQGASVTLEEAGITTLIEQSGNYHAIRPKIHQLDYVADSDQIRKLSSAPEYMLNSAPAVTQDGHILIASASGSQLPAIANGAKNVILIVGVQKIVQNLDAAWDRLENHVFPLEDARAQKAYGMHSSINKVLVINKEPVPGRTRIIFINKSIGF